MNTLIKNKIASYPAPAKTKFNELRNLIFQLAEQNELGSIEETLKWGQPAYLCKYGSTIRIDWQAATPNHIEVLFNYKTSLVETFKEVFPELSFTGNRIMLVALDTPLPNALEDCLLMTLRYHQLKKKPLLGA